MAVTVDRDSRLQPILNLQPDPSRTARDDPQAQEIDADPTDNQSSACVRRQPRLVDTVGHRTLYVHGT
jgi:hypothetical protein